MITKGEKKIILGCAKKFGVAEIYLFGSSVGKGRYNDIDLGVRGLRPELFFTFYADLFKSLPKPVDLVDLSEKSSFNSLIEEEGLKIYEKSG
ncbi:MAG: nucleotidyltransferase domain-containing protein [Candidatus Saganbacteria bacterium]|nr:nucleotidyltransferase domain-containing protein [Candidatus Saganbacteria bacterium]